MQHTARDVMTTNLIVLSPETTSEEAIHALLRNKISAAPVLNEDQELVGIVSEFQLLAVIYNEEFQNKAISELMTRDVLTVDEDAPLTEVASLFIRHRIRRLPVVRGGQVVGQISRRDIIRFAVERPDRFQRFMAMFNGEMPVGTAETVVS